MIAHLAQQTVLWCCAGLLLWAAISDLQRFVIPNRISLALVALFPIYLATGYLSGAPVDWIGGLMAGALVFTVGFGLFTLGVMGGGDVKLLAAVALYAGLNGLLAFTVVTALAGGLLSATLLTAKMISLNRIPANLRAVMLPAGGRFPVLRAALRTNTPYGAAIAFGGLFIIYQLVRA